MGKVSREMWTEHCVRLSSVCMCISESSCRGPCSRLSGAHLSTGSRKGSKYTKPCARKHTHRLHILELNKWNITFEKWASGSSVSRVLGWEVEGSQCKIQLRLASSSGWGPICQNSRYFSVRELLKLHWAGLSCFALICSEITIKEGACMLYTNVWSGWCDMQHTGFLSVFLRFHMGRGCFNVLWMLLVWVWWSYPGSVENPRSVALTWGMVQASEGQRTVWRRNVQN